MAIDLLRPFRQALARLRPKPFTHELSKLTTRAFHQLNRLGVTLEGQVDRDIAMAINDNDRKLLHDQASRRYLELFDTLLAMQAFVDKHKPRR